MGIMLEPTNQFKTINIVNSFVKENIKLQNEVFRVQKKLISVLHKETKENIRHKRKKVIFNDLLFLGKQVKILIYNKLLTKLLRKKRSALTAAS